MLYFHQMWSLCFVVNSTRSVAITWHACFSEDWCYKNMSVRNRKCLPWQTDLLRWQSWQVTQITRSASLAVSALWCLMWKIRKLKNHLWTTCRCNIFWPLRGRRHQAIVWKLLLLSNEVETTTDSLMRQMIFFFFILYVLNLNFISLLPNIPFFLFFFLSFLQESTMPCWTGPSGRRWP